MTAVESGAALPSPIIHGDRPHHGRTSVNKGSTPGEDLPISWSQNTPGEDLPVSWGNASLSSASTRGESPDPSTSYNSSSSRDTQPSSSGGTLTQSSSCSSLQCSIHDAAELGQTELLMSALRTRDVNARNEGGETALVVAAQADQIEALTLLIGQGAQSNLASSTGHTALMYAAENGNNQAVELLLSTNADPNLWDMEGWTALMFAAKEGYGRVMGLLCKATADPNFHNMERSTALSMAAQYQHPHSCTMLLNEAGLKKEILNLCDWTARTPLHYCIIHGDLETSHMMQKAGAEIDVTSDVTLYGEKDLQTGELVNGDGVVVMKQMTALMFSAHQDDTQSVVELLKAGVDPNARNQRDMTALMFAAARGDGGSVLHLLDAKADPNLQESWRGMSALMFAAGLGPQQGGDAVAALLVSAGADLDLQDKEGRAAEDWARLKGHEQTAKMLGPPVDYYEGLRQCGDAACDRATACCPQRATMGAGQQSNSKQNGSVQRTQRRRVKVEHRACCEACNLQ